jgi:hypothetical protein
MSAWIKISRPSVEVGEDFTMFQSIVVNLERVDMFAIQKPGSITFFIQGKAYSVEQSFDPAAYDAVLRYANRLTGLTLP